MPERQSRSQSFNPLLLNALLDEQDFDLGSRIASASLNHGRDVSFDRITGACRQNLFGHRALLCEL
ncbi:hypothetical protein [Microvirga yunnanensis]|nr:hypothetical protein [Microvirga sp. HBU67655]